MSRNTQTDIDTRLIKLHDWVTQRCSPGEELLPNERQHLHNQVSSLISEEVDTDCLYDGQTLLTTISGCGHLPAMRLLIENGAQLDPPGLPNPRNTAPGALPQRRTPLMLAAIYNQAAACHFLAKAGADLETVDEEGESPLFCAATHGSDAAAQCLIDLGADLGRRNTKGQSVLAQWIDKGQVDDEAWADCGRVLVRAAI